MTKQHRTTPPSAPQGSFRTAAGAGYGDAYMMPEQLAGDRRKQRIDAIQQQLVSELIAALPHGGMVVDAPCGNGRLTQLTQARADLSVVALDYNHLMLATMAQRLGDSPLLRRRAQADILHLPLPDKCVDLFINFRLMHHLRDRSMQVQMCRQMARVTRGRIITTFWTTHCWRHLRKRLLGKKIRGNPVPPSYFRSVCAEAGLRIERIVPVRRFYEDEQMAICSVA